MGKEALVEVEFKRSEQIVSALEKAGVRVSVAMWVQFPEYEDWRFVLASKNLDVLDLGDAYLSEPDTERCWYKRLATPLDLHHENDRSVYPRIAESIQQDGRRKRNAVGWAAMGRSHCG